MSRVTELEKALTALFRKGAEVGYTETEIDEFLENIDYHALLQAVWNKAETVYAYGGAVQFRFHHRQPLCHAGQSRFSRRPLKAVIFHARFREKGFDTDETPPCLHHRSVERERV